MRLPQYLLLSLAAGGFLLLAQQGDSHKGHAHNTGKMPPFHLSEAAAKPFPRTMAPESFAHPIIQRVYRIAREIPGVLVQQPCYCYCSSHGHTSLLHCHRDNHSAG